MKPSAAAEGTFTFSYNRNSELMSSMTCTNTGVKVLLNYDVMDRPTNIIWLQILPPRDRGGGRWINRGKRRETGMEQEVKVRHSEGRGVKKVIRY